MVRLGSAALTRKPACLRQSLLRTYGNINSAHVKTTKIYRRNFSYFKLVFFGLFVISLIVPLISLSINDSISVDNRIRGAIFFIVQICIASEVVLITLNGKYIITSEGDQIIIKTHGHIFTSSRSLKIQNISHSITSLLKEPSSLSILVTLGIISEYRITLHNKLNGRHLYTFWIDNQSHAEELCQMLTPSTPAAANVPVQPPEVL